MVLASQSSGACLFKKIYRKKTLKMRKYMKHDLYISNNRCKGFEYLTRKPQMSSQKSKQSLP